MNVLIRSVFAIFSAADNLKNSIMGMKNILLLNLMLLIICNAANAQMNMRQLSVNEGLSQYYVSDIVQDKYGFIWIATYDGLNRYDGACIKVYKSNPDNSGSLSSGRIKSLYFDHASDRLFIGTDGGGINIYDYASDSFRCYHIGHNSNNWLPENDIIDICPEKDGRMWIVTRKVIFLVDITQNDITVKQAIPYPTNRVITSLVSIDGALLAVAKRKVIRYIYSDDTYMQDTDILLPENTIVNSVSTSGKSLLISTTEGIYCLRNIYSGDKLSKVSISSSGLLSDMENVSATRETDGKIIFIVAGKGLYSKDMTYGEISHLNTGNDAFWEDNTIRNAIIDRSGTMWIASQNKGVGFIDLKQVIYKRLELYEGGQPCITAMMLEPDNTLWIGTETKGLYLRDKTGRIQSVLQDSGAVTDIKYFRDGTVKIVCDGKVYSWENGDLREIFPLQYDWAESVGTVFNICEDTSGTIWLGCRKGIAGVTAGKYVISNLETSFSMKVVPSRSGDALWICSGRNGLIKYNISSGMSLDIIKHYTNSREDISSISSNTVRTVYESSSGNIYVGTEMGLDIIDPRSLEIKRMDGILSQSNIFSIQEDSNGILWINTARGIVKYNPKDRSEKIYNSSDGLVSSYMTSASAISADDTLYVGTNEGVNYFCTADFPDTDNIPPQIAVSGIMVFGKPVSFDIPAMDLKTITLPYNHNSITFQLSVMSYSNPQKNRFSYRLSGYDDEWMNTGVNSPYATFNKLKKGHYTFEFRGWDSDLTPSANTVRIALIIRPAWWDTVWAYCIYALILIGIAYIIIMYFKDKIRQKSEAEANEAKLRFYDNLTHELRTPLTLVSAPLSELSIRKDLPGNAANKISVIHRNVDRLLDLANRFLDLRKIDNNGLPLLVKEQDIGLMLRNIVQRFEPLAEQKQIDIKCRIPEDVPNYGWADEEKINTIISNLLSNALKFTPKDGHITVSLKSNGKEYIIAVSDDGCGISSKEMTHIFERFYQVEKRPVSGTGIGLDLSRSLAELHKGWLKGDSKLGEGATFTFGFPYAKEDYSSEERAVNCINHSSTDTEGKAVKHISGKNRHKILIVEDDAEMAAYIGSILYQKYDTVTAENGKTGIDTTLETMPDLIVSDVMMPVMDGIKMCREITEDFRTSHIPIILLTAKNDELSGLQAGAVDYIMKPFEPRSLMLKIENLLKYKASIRLSQDSEESISQRIKEYSDLKEKEFLEKAYNIVEVNIGNSEFKVEDLMKELGVSKSQLHKKITALTGLPASAFIRNIRLDKAKEMLVTGKYSITEILYTVGFNSPSYFSKMFKERFGILPSDMLQNG